MKAPGINPCTFKVKTWFQAFAFKCNLHRYTLGSFVITAALVWVNTGSLFLTVGGMSAVVTSLAAAQFIYVFGVELYKLNSVDP